MTEERSRGLRADRVLPRGRKTCVVAAALLSCGIGFAPGTWADGAAGPGSRGGWAPGSLEELLQRFPPVEANKAALEAERLSAAIGIDLAPRDLKERARPAPEDVRRFEAVYGQLEKWLIMELERPDGGTTALPPAEVSEFLSRHAEHIGNLHDLLVRGEAPRWERHLEKLSLAPVPNLIGHIHLQKLLLADCLAHDANGASAPALSDLEASWALDESLCEEPDVFTQLIAIAVRRMEAGALRRLREVPPVWRDRLREHDFRFSMMTALQVEGWMWKYLGRPTVPYEIPSPNVEPPEGWLPQFMLEINRSYSSLAFLARDPEGWLHEILLTAGKPYIRMCAANASDLWRQHLAKLAELPALCDTDLSRLDKELFASLPWWNRLAGAFIPGAASSVSRLARLELDSELTEKILDLKAERRRTGAWPASPRGITECEACPLSHWIYKVRPDGEASLALDRRLVWPDVQMGTILPTQWSSAGWLTATQKWEIASP